MAVSYIDQDYIDARIGSSVRAALVSYLGNTLTLTAIIEDASEDVLGGIRAQGYADPDQSSPPSQVKKFVLANVLDELYGIAGQEMPDSYLRVLGKYQKFIEGELQIVGLSLAGNSQQIGGIAKTSASKTATNGRPPKFLDIGKDL